MEASNGPDNIDSKSEETVDEKDAAEKPSSPSKPNLEGGASTSSDPPRVDWADLLDEEKTNKLLYSLQIVESLGQPSKKRRTKSLVRELTLRCFHLG